MRVLWLCNIVLPELTSEFGFKKINVGGWLSGAWNELKKQDQCELAVCVPVRNPLKSRDGTFDGYKFYSFLTISKESNTNIDDQIIRFTEIVNDFRPDIIHIWGTEYEHTYSMTKACENHGILSRIVVSIQGLLTYYEKVYTIGLPENVLEQTVDGKKILEDKNDFKRRARYEQETLSIVKNVAGRTDWDRACVLDQNDKINYFQCGAILRDMFYSARKWDAKKSKKHVIFLSQANYPIKGLHLVLEELGKIASIYADLEIRVAGGNLLSTETSYGNYVESLLLEYNLVSHIQFLGLLDEKCMIEEYLQANVFLSPSLIENESNSVCEAMMLGVPVVASFVGGLSTVIEHGKSGFLYPLSEPYLMSYYIRQIFDNKDIAESLSREEIIKAANYNNKKRITKELLSMYETIDIQIGYEAQ